MKFDIYNSTVTEPILAHNSSPIPVVCVPAGNSNVEIFGIVVGVGSADDNQHPGIAHLVEHTIFKGTKRRTSFRISNCMESIGGELNAYTTKEETTIYAIFPRGYVERAINLIGDLTLNSSFPDNEVDLERDVVVNEILSYRDTPSEAVYDDFEDHLFAGTPLGHNILGNAQTIEKMTGFNCREFHKQYYVAENIVAFYSGNTPINKIEHLITKHFAGIPQHSNPRANYKIAPTIHQNIEVTTHDSQAHSVIGFATPGGIFSDNRFSMALFSNIIGGPGMNSRLNIELREKRGLVYTVEATSTFMRNAGMTTIYFGCDPADWRRCTTLVRHTLERMADKPMTSSQLERAKRQYLGQLLILNENRENRAMAAARNTLWKGSPNSEAHTIEQIQAITTDDICRCAQMFENALQFTLMPG